MRQHARDVHSFGEPWRVQVQHCTLDLTVDFDAKQLRGTAELRLVRHDPQAPLILDSRDLIIEGVHCNGEAAYEIGERNPILGSPLVIHLPDGHLPDGANNVVTIRYATQPYASGLQWLNPEQTAGKKQPFLFSQSQSIHARSWIPIQDSPAVRVTYHARIRTPTGLRAVMSAKRLPDADDSQRFEMDLPIPPYLIALGVGDIAYEPLGPRTGSTPNRRFSLRRSANSKIRKSWLKRWSDCMALTAGAAMNCWCFRQVFRSGAWKTRLLLLQRPRSLRGTRAWSAWFCTNWHTLGQAIWSRMPPGAISG